jgi:hypothetical protein
MTGFWIAVASAEHVRRGRARGFMQVCHGKAAPLRRVRPGDGIAYYSPTTTLGGKDRLQAFTAVGSVRQGDPYLADMGGGLQPWRRDVDWLPSVDAPIRPMLDALSFTAGCASWGARLRFGLLSIGEADFQTISTSMHALSAKPGNGR